MAVYYKVYKSSEKSKGAGKYYARTKALETIDLDGLAEHMAEHNTPYSEGCIRGILRDMANCIKELLLSSKKVKLDDLAILSLGVKCAGADALKDLSVKNLLKLYINAQGTGDLTTHDNELRKNASVAKYTLIDDSNATA